MHKRAREISVKCANASLPVSGNGARHAGYDVSTCLLRRPRSCLLVFLRFANQVQVKSFNSVLGLSLVSDVDIARRFVIDSFSCAVAKWPSGGVSANQRPRMPASQIQLTQQIHRQQETHAAAPRQAGSLPAKHQHQTAASQPIHQPTTKSRLWIIAYTHTPHTHSLHSSSSLYCTHFFPSTTFYSRICTETQLYRLEQTTFTFQHHTTPLTKLFATLQDGSRKQARSSY